MDLEKKLQQLKARYNELNAAMSDPGIFDDPENYTKLTKERSDLEEVVLDFDRYTELKRHFKGNIELIEMNEDPEITEMAVAENKELKAALIRLEEELKIKLVPKDPEDSKNAIVEVRAGTGGDEAAIFAGDLFDMYRRYADDLGWKLQILSLNESEKGGYKEISFSLEGHEVFGKMKFESGVHRVQRVPATESQGRVHTSAATVAVLPEVEEVDIHINPSDLRIDTFRASGAGGQHVNKTDSAIRITHEPTGIVAECQQERSQHQNKEKAMAMLRARMYDIELEKKQKARAAERKSQVSTGDRSAKIRTYNYPQGRLTDHRINLTLYNLDAVMKGQLHEVIEGLRIQDNLEKMQEMIE
ncbi:MAG: peptide chain release factor 1 [Bacteroidetes bacterium]|nr:peptide chain release factor 1 [Bacteroidota bacterium]MDA1126321.1 peptide chain release factor 1 [Bacteroidota bacterium]